MSQGRSSSECQVFALTQLWKQHSKRQIRCSALTWGEDNKYHPQQISKYSHIEEQEHGDSPAGGDFNLQSLHRTILKYELSIQIIRD